MVQERRGDGIRDSVWCVGQAEPSLIALAVSQFTLHAVFKGAKPDFHHSMAADRSKAFCASPVRLRTP